jgi:carbonic anhydrase
MKKNRIILIALAIICVISMGTLAAEEKRPVTADEAVTLLKEGNERFVRMQPEHPDMSAARRKALAVEGQKPFAAVLGCSDSRVPVEEVFDRGIGDIFVIRVAGNVAMGPAVIGSAEYAVKHLGTPVIVVLGHTGCGAVKAAISGPPLEGSVRDIQKKIEPVVSSVKARQPGLKDDGLITAVVKANVMNARRDLYLQSAQIRRLLLERKIRILAAVYDMKTGAVEWID